MRYKKVKLEDIVNYLSEEVVTVYGATNSISIDNIPDASQVKESSLDWINSTRTNKQLDAENSKAKVLVVDETVEFTQSLKEQGKTLLVVSNPRKTMAMIADHFFIEKPQSGIHQSAIIDNDANVHPTAHIGAGCIIGKATVGAHTILMPNVVIYDDVEIGDNCLIQAGAIIGTDGLGCIRDCEGRLTKFPHLGGVKIGNDVEIGANCQIARGAFSDTIIENGCKINGLCFVAHNCHLEENVWITGDTMLCGSVHVNRNTTIFSNVIVREQRVLGEHSVIGMGSVVTKNVPADETWIGSPAHKFEKK